MYWFILHFSFFQSKIKPTVQRTGWSAIRHFVLGPPKMKSNLHEERNLVFAIAQCMYQMVGRLTFTSNFMSLMVICIIFFSSHWINLNYSIAMSWVTHGKSMGKWDRELLSKREQEKRNRLEHREKKRKNNRIVASLYKGKRVNSEHSNQELRSDTLHTMHYFQWDILYRWSCGPLMKKHTCSWNSRLGWVLLIKVCLITNNPHDQLFKI